ncbi:hypothetical protein PBI_RHYNO_3 [Mycobacterium phage RhynO]|uniref:hypothetical protein n=1 Tax=Mycobacterium phage RhynO TaxID=1458846 RepID=UPI0003F1D3B9|nr:hypothetical protein CG97_gp03 [Mycobacterium phage RhynO]AHJ88663.1 hypothetical protein PBI_RHYNO_3 [Mycobacterium phage RhynO]
MSVIGPQLDQDTLVLTRGRDFKWSFENLGPDGQPVDFPAGSLFFEFPDLDGEGISPLKWVFTVSGSIASIKIESAAVNAIPARAKWQLVFLPEGEESGGDPIALGIVQIQG